MKYFLSLLLLLLATFSSNAQAPGFVWANQAQSPLGSYSWPTAMAVDHSGNSYVTGSFLNTTTFGNITLNGNGSTDLFIAKYDALGNLLWVRMAGDIYVDRGFGIAVDSSNNCYLTGEFEGSITFDSTTISSSSHKNIFIAKFDPSGNLFWLKKPEGTSYNRGSSITVDDSGNSYITGSFLDTITFGNTTLISHLMGKDVFVVKYDASGNAIWAKKAGGPYGNEGSGIAIDSIGNSYVTGYFSATALFDSITLVSSGLDDIFIAKYDVLGNVLWAKRAGGNSFDSGTSIAVDGSGNSYVTGYFMGISTFGSITLIGSGNKDAFVIKFDHSGNINWAKKAGSLYDDLGLDIAVESNGNSYVTGFLQDSIIFGPTTFNNGPGLIVKFDNAGNVLWVIKGPGAHFSAGFSIAVDNNKNSYITGYFKDTIIFNNTLLFSIGIRELFIAKLNAAPLGTKENAHVPAPSITLEAHHNPFQQNLTIKLTSPSPSHIHLTLTDILGRIIEQRELAAGEHNLKTDHLTPGLYLLLAQQEGKSRQLKVMKSQ